METNDTLSPVRLIPTPVTGQAFLCRLQANFLPPCPSPCRATVSVPISQSAWPNQITLQQAHNQNSHPDQLVIGYGTCHIFNKADTGCPGQHFCGYQCTPAYPDRNPNPSQNFRKGIWQYHMPDNLFIGRPERVRRVSWIIGFRTRLYARKSP